MTESEKECRKLQVQQALAVASLGGKTISEKELELAQKYVEGKNSLEEFSKEADDLQIITENI